MTEESKRRMKQYFKDMLNSIKDGEIHVVPFGDESEEEHIGNEI